MKIYKSVIYKNGDDWYFSDIQQVNIRKNIEQYRIYIKDRCGKMFVYCDSWHKLNSFLNGSAIQIAIGARDKCLKGIIYR